MPDLVRFLCDHCWEGVGGAEITNEEDGNPCWHHACNGHIHAWVRDTGRDSAADKRTFKAYRLVGYMAAHILELEDGPNKRGGGMMPDYQVYTLTTDALAETPSGETLLIKGSRYVALGDMKDAVAEANKITRHSRRRQYFSADRSG